jgi:hypothetical protein
MAKSNEKSEKKSAEKRGAAKTPEKKPAAKAAAKAPAKAAAGTPAKKSVKGKKKRSSSDLHRQVKDSLQALPYVIDQQKKEGHGVRAFFIRYLSGPVLKVMNKALDAKRYRGKEGEKRKQTDQMRRHLDQKGAALKHVQSQLQAQQRRKRPL